MARHKGGFKVKGAAMKEHKAKHHGGKRRSHKRGRRK